MPIALAAGLVAVLLVVLYAGAFVAVNWNMQHAADQCRNCGNSVAGFAVIGGALSWAFFQLAALIDGVSAWAASQIGQKVHDGVYALTQFIGTVIDNVPTWTSHQLNYAVTAVNRFAPQIDSIIPQTLASVQYQLSILVGQMVSVLQSITWLTATAGRLAQAVDYSIPAQIADIRSFVDYLRNVTVGNLIWQVNTLVSQMVGVLQWEQNMLGRVIPGLQADINARALERDLEALRDRVVANERAIAVLWTLAVLAAAGADVIDEVIRIGRDPCGVCAGLDLSDMEGRVAALEVNSG